MNNDISFLIVRLLQSNVPENRYYIGKSIMEVVVNLYDGNEDRILIGNFSNLLSKCVEDPKSGCRYTLYQIGQYYDDHINRSKNNAATAA